MREYRASLKYLPWPGAQTNLHLSRRLWKVAVCGARSGKTLSMAAELLSNALEQPNYREADIERGIPYMIGVGAPTFPMVNRIIVPTILQMVPGELLVTPYHHTNHLLRVYGRRGETWIYFIATTHYTSWQGQDLAGIWLDEFALMKEQMYFEAQTRLANQRGWLLMSGTPHGPNWAKERVYEFAQTEKGREKIHFTSWPTTANPYFPKAELAELRATMDPKFFRRTFEASWDSFAGQIYEDWLESVHTFRPQDVMFAMPNNRRMGGVGGSAGTRVRIDRVVAGVDWGYGAGHPGVILVAGWDGQRKTWWILEESCEEQVLVSGRPGTDTWVNRAVALRAKWGIEVFYCDHDPEAQQQFRLAGLDVAMAKKDVIAGIQSVAGYMRIQDAEGGFSTTNLRVSTACKTLISEIPFYHWRDGREQPEKTMDHACDALRYVVFTDASGQRFERQVGYSA